MFKVWKFILVKEVFIYSETSMRYHVKVTATPLVAKWEKYCNNSENYQKIIYKVADHSRERIK